MLQRMYTRWAERHGMKVEMIDYHAGEQAGDQVGDAAGQRARTPMAMPRPRAGCIGWCEISPYDSSARRHTSFSSVWVYPVIDDDIDVEVKRRRPQDRHLSRLGRWRAAHQHHRFGGAHHPHPHRHRRPVPEPAQPAQEQGRGDEPAPRAALRTRIVDPRGRRQCRERHQDRYRLGPPDPLLRAPAVSAREGFAHRSHFHCALGRARWGTRPVHGRRAIPARDREAVEVEDVD